MKAGMAIVGNPRWGWDAPEALHHGQLSRVLTLFRSSFG